MRVGLLLSLAFLFGMAAAASAADWYTGASDDTSVKTAPTVAIDMAIDATSQNALAGALIRTIAPFAPLDQSGMRVRLSGVAGKYDYASSDLGIINGVLEQGAFLVGYEWVGRQIKVAGFVGAEAAHNSITPNDPNNSVKGTYGGLKLGVDFYSNPTDATMLSGVATFSTNHDAYYVRAKFGVAVGDQLYVGPEALLLGDDFFHQLRIGGHTSGFKIGPIQAGVSGGYLYDYVRGSGGYGILETRVMF
jgi:hypothetical protein